MSNNTPKNDESWMITSVRKAKNSKGIVNLSLKAGSLCPVIPITEDCAWKLVKKYGVKRWYQLAGKTFPHTCPEARTDLRNFLSA